MLAREDEEDDSSGAGDGMHPHNAAGFPLFEHGNPDVAGSDSDGSGGWETDEGSDDLDAVS